MRLPDSPDIIWAGFGTEKDKFDEMSLGRSTILEVNTLG